VPFLHKIRTGSSPIKVHWMCGKTPCFWQKHHHFSVTLKTLLLLMKSNGMMIALLHF